MVPEVPKEILHLLSAWAAPVLTVPVPTAAAALSPAPAHTVTPCGRPNAAAVSGSSVPTGAKLSYRRGIWLSEMPHKASMSRLQHLCSTSSSSIPDASE